MIIFLLFVISKYMDSTSEVMQKKFKFLDIFKYLPRIHKSPMNFGCVESVVTYHTVEASRLKSEDV